MKDQREEQAGPSMDDSLKQSERHPNPISNSPAGMLLQNFIDSMNEFGEDAQETYKEALEAMRQHAEEVIFEIAQGQRHCHQDDYPFKWALVHAAAELRHPAALPFLRNVVKTPIPPERSENPHSYSTVAEETILRTTAVEGVEYLAARKGEKTTAVEALFEFLKQPSLSIRRAAVQALLAVDGGKQQRDRILKLLPEDQHFLLKIERKDVRDVPQIEDPQSHLREAARQIEKESPPRIPGTSKDDGPQVY